MRSSGKGRGWRGYGTELVDKSEDGAAVFVGEIPLRLGLQISDGIQFAVVCQINDALDNLKVHEHVRSIIVILAVLCLSNFIAPRK